MRWQSRILAAGLAVAAILFSPSPAGAQSPDVEKLLALLVKKNVISSEEAAAFREEVAQEKSVEQVRAAAAAQAAPPPSERPVTASKAVRMSGYAQLRHSSVPGTDNSFELRRARLSLAGNVTERVSFRLQADMVRSPILLDAYADVKLLAWMRTSFGQFKVPFSQENLTGSQNLLTVDRSLVVTSLVPGRDTGQNGRDIGFKIEGNIVRGDGRPLFDYSFAGLNGAGINRRDDNHRKDFNTRIVTHLARGLWVGGSYYNGATGATKVFKDRSEFEFNFTRGKATLQGEYIWGRDGVIHKRGSYTQLAWRFVPKWEGVFRFEELEPNSRIANDDSKVLLFGANWYTSQHLKFQFNFESRDDANRPRRANSFFTQAVFSF